jgi:hypothetical protein
MAHERVTKRTPRLVVDEFTDKCIPVMGREDNWYDYSIRTMIGEGLKWQ